MEQGKEGIVDEYGRRSITRYCACMLDGRRVDGRYLTHVPVRVRNIGEVLATGDGIGGREGGGDGSASENLARGTGEGSLGETKRGGGDCLRFGRYRCILEGLEIAAAATCELLRTGWRVWAYVLWWLHRKLVRAWL